VGTDQETNNVDAAKTIKGYWTWGRHILDEISSAIRPELRRSCRTSLNRRRLARQETNSPCNGWRRWRLAESTDCALADARDPAARWFARALALLMGRGHLEFQRGPALARATTQAKLVSGSLEACHQKLRGPIASRRFSLWRQLRQKALEATDSRPVAGRHRRHASRLAPLGDPYTRLVAAGRGPGAALQAPKAASAALASSSASAQDLGEDPWPITPIEWSAGRGWRAS